MQELGIDAHFPDKCAEWDCIEVLVCARGSTHEHLEQLCKAATAAPLLTKVERCQGVVLDSDHSLFDVDKFCASLKI